MGVIRRQGVASGIFLYIGVILGFINSVLLFPKVLGAEIFGFCQFLVATANILGILSLVGLPMTTIRYFPYFRNRDKSHGGFLSFLLILTTAGSVFVLVALLTGKSLMMEWFGDEESGPILNSYYWTLITLFLFGNFCMIITSYSNALKRARIPSLINDVGGRLITFVLLILVLANWLGEHGFLSLYAFKNLFNLIPLIFFLWLIREWYLRWDTSVFRHGKLNEMINFGGFAFLTQIGNNLVNRIDIIMISGLMRFNDTGVYSLFYFLTLVIPMSHTALGKIISPVIADHWADKDMEALNDLYKRSALNNLVMAVLVFIGILVNMDNIVAILGPEYSRGTIVAVFLGISQLANVINGYNNYVLIHSDLYRYDLVFKVALGLLTVLTNYFLITAYGIAGAAVATALTLVILNFTYQWFIYRKFHLHPFSLRMVRVFFVGTISFAAGYFLPVIENYIVDIIIRSGLVIILYGMLTLLVKASPDINQYVMELWRKYF